MAVNMREPGKLEGKEGSGEGLGGIRGSNGASAHCALEGGGCARGVRVIAAGVGVKCAHG